MGEVSRLVSPAGELAATWKNQERSSIDTTKLKKEQPEMAEKYAKTTSSRVFRVLSDE
jgi:predicted phage-related endonuclease